MTGCMLDVIAKNFPLTELPCGEYEKMKVSGMNFRIRRFHAEGHLDHYSHGEGYAAFLLRPGAGYGK